MLRSLVGSEMCIRDSFSRYVDKVNRREVKRAFARVLASGQAEKLKSNITLISNDFRFGIGAEHDLLARLSLSPKYNIHGDVDGVLFEAKDISNEKLLADVYAHVLAHGGQPLVFAEPGEEDRYNAPGMELPMREHHGPIIAVGYDRVNTGGTEIKAISHAAMLKLKIDPTNEMHRVLRTPFVDMLGPGSLDTFLSAQELVVKKGEYGVIDCHVQVGEHMVPMALTLSPWYDSMGQIRGTIVGFEGELAGFSLDSDGFITDCTDAAVFHLGYDKQDIVGVELVTFVDPDSLFLMGDSIMELFDDEEYPSPEMVPDIVVPVTLVRESGRMVQSCWDMTRIPGPNPDMKYAMVVLHKEKWLPSIRGRDKQGEAMEPAPEPKPSVSDGHGRLPKPAPAKKQKESVHLTPFEKAEAETEAVRYHYAVMQELNDCNGGCTFNDFKRYLFTVQKEYRPWGLHTTNMFMKPAVVKKYKEISGGDLGPITFQQWEDWWNTADKRSNWDGGEKMSHVDPPGKQNPFDL
eukprot:TRINITY_DN4054_c0_g1_i3.p1 TRINITY_DN4054_c0_g1~~TRINITY_DN4054_c0_g1_i3.p1  ORF type:complete len:519 (+),score=163.52 TRINITY_DN4054_c0_g1_i3:112-1668(+)